MIVNIGSYNIRHGADAAFDMQLIGKNITDKSLDIVGLQEVDQNAIRSNHLDTMKELAVATGYEHYAFFKAIPLRGGAYGVGILSKYPILKTECYLLDSEGTNEQRVLGRAAIDVEGETVQFFVTHLSYESTETRARQFKQINEVLKDFENYILTGDFNTEDFEEFRLIEGAELVNDTDRRVPTFPSKMLAIDNIVYDAKNLRFDAPMTVSKSYSDHYMLYAKGIFEPRK